MNEISFNASIYLETTPQVMGNRKAAVVIDLSGDKVLTRNEIFNKVLGADFPNVIVRGQKIKENGEVKNLLKDLSLKRFAIFQTTPDDNFEALRVIRGVRFIIETDCNIAQYAKNLRLLKTKDILVIAVDSLKEFEQAASMMLQLRLTTEVVFKFSSKVVEGKAFAAWMEFERTSPRWVSTSILIDAAEKDGKKTKEEKKEPVELKEPVVVKEPEATQPETGDDLTRQNTSENTDPENQPPAEVKE